MKFCAKCVYPESAVNLSFDEDGICSACRFSEEYSKISDSEWSDRQKILYEEIKSAGGRTRSRGSYDCVIAVSGGKDSYWQTHVIKNILGFHPLLVTYHGNNYLPEGQYNLDRMRRVFDTEHIIFYPGEEKLKKLNRAGFQLMGDMNWHAHAGIKTIPMQVAAAYKIPIVIWGEVTWSISGMFSPNDYVEYNVKTVREHDLRGWNIDHFFEVEGLSRDDLSWLEMPTDEEVLNLNLRGLYIGNYLRWDANEHTDFVKRIYGFQEAETPFQRTYRIMSNLDDMHENGIHDYLKYLKFGYGRASDHASKDIRDGYITREQGIELVRRFDHVFPELDFNRWLQYVGMNASKFHEIAENFRNLSIWRRDRLGANWVKDELWE